MKLPTVGRKTPKMSGRGRGKCIPTRKNPGPTANGKGPVEEPEEELVVESGEEGAMASGLTVEAQVVEDQQWEPAPEVDHPSVKPKMPPGKIHGTSKLSTSPQSSEETIPLGQQFMNEMREFMYRQQRNEKKLFDGLEDLKHVVYQKSKQDLD